MSHASHLVVRRFVHVVVASCALVTLAPAQGKAPAKPAADAPKGHVETIAELGLTLTMPDAFTELEAMEPPGKNNTQRKGGWTGKLGASALTIVLYAMPSDEFGYEEPEDVTDTILENFRDNSDKSFVYATTELLDGKFGFAPYGALGWGPIHGKDGSAIVGTYCVLGGLLEKYGYALELIAEPALDPASEKIATEFLRKGVAYAGKARDPQWTAEEHKARWLKDAPPDLAKKLEKAVRTKHYIFLSNTSAQKQMGEAMEACYEQIKKTYPFTEVSGRKLMPVFLFRNPEEYHAFYAKQFKSTVEEAAKSKGVAFEDFYATYYDAPQDPVHIHEATHQIFKNRLRLGGGGSWFQEGVAEYICTKPSDRVDAANLVKKNKQMKLVEFVAIESLLWSAKDDKKGGDEASSSYALAALLVEYVRESKETKGKFLDWVHAVGVCPRKNLVAIERATQATLGVDLAGLEAKWVEYCKKR